MQAVVDDYNHSQNRVFVKKLTGLGEIERKLMRATAGGDPPDIAGIWPATIHGFYEKGALTPLDKFIKEAGIQREDYIPVYWNLCSYHGFQWALPSTPTSLALHWNKKLFREAGLDPNRPPQSLDELERMSERLTIVEIKRGGKIVRVHYPDLTADEKKAKDFKLVQVGHDPQQPGWWMPMWVFWFGGKLWDGQRHITANSPEFIQTFQWLREQSEKYGVDNRRGFGASFGNFQSPQNPFFSDQIDNAILEAQSKAQETLSLNQEQMDKIHEKIQQAQEKMAEAQAKFMSVVDTAVKNAPAGTENAVALVKSAVAAANNAFESVQKAGKQAAEVAEANFQALSTTAVRATKSKKA